jgi:hypothetical protein
MKVVEGVVWGEHKLQAEHNEERRARSHLARPEDDPAPPESLSLSLFFFTFS